MHTIKQRLCTRFIDFACAVLAGFQLQSGREVAQERSLLRVRLQQPTVLTALSVQNFRQNAVKTYLHLQCRCELCSSRHRRLQRRIFSLHSSLLHLQCVEMIIICIGVQFSWRRTFVRCVCIGNNFPHSLTDILATIITRSVVMLGSFLPLFLFESRLHRFREFLPTRTHTQQV